MCELEYLGTYNCDIEHDMLVDFKYLKNIDELPNLCDNEAVNDFINNPNELNR